MDEKKYIFLILFLLSTKASFSQKTDSTYISPYPHKMWATTHVSTGMLQLQHNKKTLVPNFPINAGVGLGIRNTVINFLLGRNISPLKSSEYGKTKAIDLQIHSYGRRYLIDLYYQKYKGFYTEDNKLVDLYPRLSAQQIGAEGTYIFNGNKFSAKAAFEQSEKQILSVGSFLLGTGIYWHRIIPDENQNIASKDPFNNLQIGIHAGYAYSWVLDDHWLISSMTTAGANLGNHTEVLKDGHLKIYPTVLARASSTYNKKDWSISYSMLINNKIVYPSSDKSFSLTALNMRISYVKQLDSFFNNRK